MACSIQVFRTKKSVWFITEHCVVGSELRILLTDPNQRYSWKIKHCFDCYVLQRTIIGIKIAHWPIDLWRVKCFILFQYHIAEEIFPNLTNNGSEHAMLNGNELIHHGTTV